MALALYRNYRPKKFKDVIGQDDVAVTLRNQVAAGRTSHAYLFTGIRGTGKTTFARILAKAVNCRDVTDGEPCGICEICRGIDNGSILDVTEIDGASNTGVDNIRELRDEAAYVPAITDKRVYIIDEVHMLSVNASNALLKILEEPPEHVMFILATTDPQKIIATILSRCQRYDLKRISGKNISGYLMMVSGKESIKLEPEASEIIAKLADGSIRDALSILDRCASSGAPVLDKNAVLSIVGTADNEQLFELTDYIASADAGGALKLIDHLFAAQLNPSAFAAGLMSHFRDMMMIKSGAVQVLGDYPQERISRCKEQSGRFTKSQIIYILKQLKEFLNLLPVSSDRRLQLEICIIELCSLSGDPADEPETKPSEMISGLPPEHSRNSDNQKLNVEINIEPTQNCKQTKSESLTEQAVKDQAESADITDDVQKEKPPERSGDGQPGHRQLLITEDLPRNQNPIDEGAPPLFEEWPKVVEAFQRINPMLHGFLNGATAYNDGERILIDCGEVLKNQLRDNSGYAGVIKDVIAGETGVRLPVGAYDRSNINENETQNQSDGVLDDFIARAKQLGIPVKVTE